MTLDDARYLSPEQAMGEHRGPESDVYAWRSFSLRRSPGRPPTRASTAEAILARSTRYAAAGATGARHARHGARPGGRAGPASATRRRAVLRRRLGASWVTRRRSSCAPAPRDAAARAVRAARTAQLHWLQRALGRTDHGLAQPIIAARAFPEHRAVRSRASPAFERRSDARRDSSVLAVRPAANRASRRWRILVAAIIIVVVAIVAGVVWKLGVFKTSYAVPNLVGMTTKQASTAIASDGFTLSIIDVTIRHGAARTRSSARPRWPARRRSPGRH